MAYVFIPLIQNELDSFKKNWNTHRIRKQDIYRPCGIPNFLYEFPDQNGEFNVILPVENFYDLNYPFKVENNVE